jgi:DNA primase
MMDDKFIATLLQGINIIDIVGSYVQLKRSGSNFKACCPFHEEKTPSFLVSEQKQIYKCFGCGKAGNAITFVRDVEKISFNEAVKKLAERINLQIPDTPQKKEKNSKIELIHQIYALTNDFFVENLKKHGSLARKYLQSRDISDSTIEKFSLGYSLDSFSALKSYLQKNHINDEIMKDCGLFKVKDDKVYDMFRDRLMFPIANTAGKIVAYGARALTAEQEKQGKYINSPTSPIYTKGNELYGLNNSRFEISKKKASIIVEGYMDFLRMWESGFHHVVASLGTALTENQVQILGRYSSQFLMLYDGDKAGRNAAVKAAAIILKKGYSVKIVSIPNNDDPDSFLRNHPPAEMDNLIANALPLPEFLKRNQDLMSTRESIDLMLSIAQDFKDPVQRDLFIQNISDIFSVSEQSIREKAARVPQYSAYSEEKKPKKQSAHKNLEEVKLLQTILKNKEALKKVASQLTFDYFMNENFKSIYKTLTENEVMNYIDNSAELLNKFEDEELKTEVSGLLLSDEYQFDVEDLICQIKLRKFQEELKRINEEISKNPDDVELFEKKIFLKKEIQSLSKSVVHKTLF